MMKEIVAINDFIAFMFYLNSAWSETDDFEKY